MGPTSLLLKLVATGVLLCSAAAGIKIPEDGGGQRRRLDKRMAMAEGKGSSVCDPKFYRFSETHTACRRRSSSAADEGVDEAAKGHIVSAHNRYRAAVENSRHQQPAATNMQRMYWDDELALVAQKWASYCYWDHDASGDRTIPGSYAVGQNLGLGHQNWTYVINHWHSEYKHLKFGEGPTSRIAVGHYTQLVWAESARVGCGYARCNGTKNYYVCNYAPTGNRLIRQYEPYKAGTQGADCRRTLKDGLCDCRGKVCKNGGTLDPNTCSCSCHKLPWIVGGDCSLDCDEAVDGHTCKSRGGPWDRETCLNFINVPSEYCPVMCGLCPEKVNGNANSTTFLPKSITSGSRPQPTMAPTITSSKGTNPRVALPPCQGSEPPQCGQPSSSRATHVKSFCFTSSTAAASICPAMCGQCAASTCRAHDGRLYREGMTWTNEYGLHRCTQQGVVVVRGCYLAELELYMRRSSSKLLSRGDVHYDCRCFENFSMKCHVRKCAFPERSSTKCEMRWIIQP